MHVRTLVIFATLTITACGDDTTIITTSFDTFNPITSITMSGGSNISTLTEPTSGDSADETTSEGTTSDETTSGDSTSTPTTGEQVDTCPKTIFCPMVECPHGPGFSDNCEGALTFCLLWGMPTNLCTSLATKCAMINATDDDICNTMAEWGGKLNVCQNNHDPEEMASECSCLLSCWR